MTFCRIVNYTTFLCKPKIKTISLKIIAHPQPTLKTVLGIDFCLSFWALQITAENKLHACRSSQITWSAFLKAVGKYVFVRIVKLSKITAKRIRRMMMMMRSASKDWNLHYMYFVLLCKNEHYWRLKPEPPQQRNGHLQASRWESERQARCAFDLQYVSLVQTLHEVSHFPSRDHAIQFSLLILQPAGTGCLQRREVCALYQIF